MPFYATSTRDLMIPVFSFDQLPFKMGLKVYGPKMAKMHYSKFAIHEIFISAVQQFTQRFSRSTVQRFSGSRPVPYGTLPEPLEYFWNFNVEILKLISKLTVLQ